MRILVVIILSAAIGTAFGAGWAYYEIGSSMRSSPLSVSADPLELVKPAPGQPRVDVDQVSHHFGKMQRGAKKSHDFTFKNVGERPLELEVGPSTCKCTIGSVPEQSLAPGESAKVNVEWTANVDQGPFRQTAVIFTTDPLMPRVELHIEGTVTEASGLIPASFFFDKIHRGDSKSADVYLMAYLQDDLEVTKAEINDESLRPYFDLTIEPLPKDQLPDPEAKSGAKISLTAKPGIVPGRFGSWVRLTTNLADAQDLDVPVEGQVIGEISVHSRAWDEYRAILQLGRVLRSEGTTQVVNIMVRGEAAQTAELEIIRTEPPELIATIGEPRRPKPGLLYIPLTLKVPPGTRPMARLAIPQSEPGVVVLKTNLEDQPELILKVAFTVER